MVTIRDILNRIIWDRRLQPENYVIFYISRGKPGDVEYIPCNLIERVSRDYVTFKRQGVTLSIPHHRIILILDVKNMKPLFKSPKLKLDVETFLRNIGFIK